MYNMVSFLAIDFY